MPTNDTTIFSAEYDSSGIVRGAEAAANALLKQKAAEDGLTASMEANDAVMKEKAAEINVLIKANEGLASSNANQTKQIENLQKQYAGLQQSYREQLQAMDQLKNSNTSAQAAIEKTTQSVAGLKNTAAQPVNIAPSITQLNTLTQKFQQTFQQLRGFYSADAFEALQNDAKGAQNNINLLREVVDALKKDLSEEQVGSQAFEAIAASIRDAQQAITQYDKIVNDATTKQEPKFQSLRSRIKDLRNELTQLEEAGQEESARYKEVQMQAARLTDQYGDMQQQIRILASDTKEIDFGIAAVDVAASGYQLFAGSLELFGLSSDDSAEAQAKLLAIMNVVQAAQQLQNLLLKEGTFLTVGQSIADATLARVNAFLAVSYGEAATAATAFMTSIGIGVVLAAVIALGALIYKIREINKANAEAERQQKLYNNSLAAGADDAADATKKINELKVNVDLAKKGLIDKRKVVEEYNKSIGETTGKVKTLDEVEQGLAKNAEAYIKFTLLKAAANFAFGEAAKKAVQAELDAQKKANEFQSIGTNASVFGVGQVTAPGFVPGTDPAVAAAAMKKAAKKAQDDAVKESQDAADELNKIAANFQKQAADIAQKNKFSFFGNDTTKTNKIENVFAQKLAELQSTLANSLQNGLVDETTIRNAARAAGEKMLLEIDNLLKEKKLTNQQANILRELVIGIDNANLEKTLKDYNDKRKELMKKIDDELYGLQVEDGKQRLGLLQDQFAQQLATIDLEQTNGIRDLQRRLETKFTELDKDFASGLFGDPASPEAKAVFEKAKQGYQVAIDLLIQDVIAEANRKKEELGFNIFQAASTDLQARTGANADNRDAQTNRSIIALNQQFLNGKIAYQKYQDELTKIVQQGAQRRLDAEIKGLNAQIDLITGQIAAGGVIVDGQFQKLTDDQAKQLQDQLSELENQRAGKRKEQSDNDVKDFKETNDKKIQLLKDYVQAYGDLVNTIGSFLQQLNQAEESRLDRSIALQQRRVSYAQYLAEHGNAKYLELEEQRLDELQRKREAAAQKQLAIDNALRLSQASLAAISAIAQAVSTGNPFAAIAAVAAVIAAIGAAYNFVNTLNQPVSTFAEGTTYVPLNGNKAGIDTVPSMLTAGEAVLPVDVNRDYHPAIQAMYNRSIPASLLNDFVSRYPNETIANVDYSRLGIATENSYKGGNNMAETNNKLNLLHDDMQELSEKISEIQPVNIKMDQDGFAIALMHAVHKQTIFRKQ